MSEPYLTGGPNGEKNWYGSTSIPREELAKMAKTMVENNIQINFHANGGGAIDDAIYAIEKSGITAKDDKRPIIIHSQFQRPDHLKKYVELGITPSYFTNHVFFWGDVHIKNVGEKNASFISPLKTAKEMGIVTSNHTDFNVTPLNPFFILWTATNRITRSGKVLGADERVDAYAALQGLTTGPAFQFFEENRKGKIKEGMLADLVILKNNPLKQKTLDLKDNEVIETIKEGKTIYKKKNEVRSMPGGWSIAEVSPDVEKALDFVLKRMNTSAKLEKILTVKTQIVKGINYDIDFLLDNGEIWNTIIYRDLSGDYTMTKPASLKDKNIPN